MYLSTKSTKAFVKCQGIHKNLNFSKYFTIDNLQIKHFFSVGLRNMLCFGLKEWVSSTMKVCWSLLMNLGVGCKKIKSSNIETSMIFLGSRNGHRYRSCLGLARGKVWPLGLIPTLSNTSYLGTNIIYHKLQGLDVPITVVLMLFPHLWVLVPVTYRLLQVKSN
jgi:hypothetical protein